MRELIIAIFFNTIGCLIFGMAFMQDIMFPKITTIVIDFILFAVFVAITIFIYQIAIETLKTQTKSEYLDEIRRHLKK